MDNKLKQKSHDIESEMQKLRNGFLDLKKKRKALQQKIDAFKEKSS